MNRFVFVVLGLVIAAASCADDVAERAPVPLQRLDVDVVDDFRSDLARARYSTAAAHAVALDQAVTAHPDDARIALARGLAHLWHVAESARDPALPAMSVMQEAGSLPGLFQRAKMLDPDDPRIDCWLGSTSIQVGAQTGDEETLARGVQLLEAGVTDYPEFNLFCRALAFESLPAADPRFAQAVDGLFDGIDLCVGEHVDRARPDISSFLDEQNVQGVCANDEPAPHAAEGFFLYFGDLLVKRGSVELAQVMYRNATHVPQYDSWPYKSLLQTRLGEDLAARAALYRDADLQNDPAPGGSSIQRSCAYCHAERADE